MLKCHPPWYEFEPTAAMFKIVTEDTKPELPPHCSEHVAHFLQLCFIKLVLCRGYAAHTLYKVIPYGQTSG